MFCLIIKKNVNVAPVAAFGNVIIGNSFAHHAPGFMNMGAIGKFAIFWCMKNNFEYIIIFAS